MLIDASEKSLFRWRRFLEVPASGSSGSAADVAAGAADDDLPNVPTLDPLSSAKSRRAKVIA